MGDSKCCKFSRWALCYSVSKILRLQKINVVRNIAQKQSLMDLGANCVVIQDDLKSIRDFTGGTLPVLALNSIGSVSALSLIETLADNGTMVMFGAMAGERVSPDT